MKAIGIAAVVLLLAAGSVIGFAYSGIFEVAATASDAPVVRWILETTRENSVRRRAEQVSVPELSGRNRTLRGAKAFDEMCAGCHGAPGREPFLGAGDMNPPPPELAKMVGNRSPQELFWVIKNGLRMTGMPAWGPTHGDDLLWDLVALMTRLPELVPDGYRALVEGLGEDGHVHDHGAAVHTDAGATVVADGAVSERDTHDAKDGHVH